MFAALDVIDDEIEMRTAPFRQRYPEGAAVAEHTKMPNNRPTARNRREMHILLGLRRETLDLFPADLLEVRKANDQEQDHQR